VICGGYPPGIIGKKGGKKKMEGILAHSNNCFGFWNDSSPFMEDKFWLIKCPPNTLEYFCWW
jgi:hypothetical protein